jgi:hypothetical protein
MRADIRDGQEHERSILRAGYRSSIAHIRLATHGRSIQRVHTVGSFASDGPLTTCVATVKATLHEIEASIAIQNEGFENLVRGSQVNMNEVLERAPSNW